MSVHLRTMTALLASVFIYSCSPSLRQAPAGADTNTAGTAWLRLEQLENGQRLLLETAQGQEHLVVASGMRNLCGVKTSWLENAVLDLEWPSYSSRYLMVRDRQAWEGITIRARFHQRQVTRSTASPNREHSLVLIEECDGDGWNLYLRNSGQAPYSEAMLAGKPDPQEVAAGKQHLPVTAIEWLTENTARISVSARPADITTLKKLGDIKLLWIFSAAPLPLADQPAGNTVEFETAKIGRYGQPAVNPDGDRLVVWEEHKAWLESKKTGKRLLLADGFPTRCGMEIWWYRMDELSLKVPEPYRHHIRVKNAQVWDKTTIGVMYHEEWLEKSKPAPGWAHRIIMVRDCENTKHSIYVRKDGESNYNEVMDKGWDDPSLVALFPSSRQVLAFDWLNEKKASITLRGVRGDLPLRDKALGIEFEWVFKP